MCEKKKSSGMQAFLIREPDFYKKALALIFPVVMQSIINQGVNMMDTVMVGKLGEVAISASSLANQFYQIYTFLCMGISAAGLVLASQYWGANKSEAVKRVYDLCIQLVAAIGVCFAAVSLFIPERIMGIFIHDEDVIREGARYLRITAFVFLPHGLSLVITNIIRSVGNAKLGLLTSCLSFLINIGANYVFIFGKMGMPELGVMGAAVGTLCARLVELAVCIVYMLWVERTVQYRPNALLKLPGTALLKEFRRLGLPAIISDTLLGLAASVMSMILGRMGKEVVSAYAIVMVLDRMCSVATMGVASAAGVIVGQTVGSGNRERAQKEGETFLIIGIALGAVAAALVLILGTLSVDLYEITQETRKTALLMMDSSAIVVFFQTIQSTLSKGVLRGGGDTRFLMVADVIFQWCASIPLGYIAGVILKVPPFGVLLILRIDYIIKSIWLTFRLKSGRWIHQAKQIT